MNNIVKDFEDVITAEFNEYDYLSEDINENSLIINLWEPLDFKIDENYEYVPDNIIYTKFNLWKILLLIECLHVSLIFYNREEIL